jgi:hypothetical protein
MAFFSLTDIKLNSGEQFDRNFSFQTPANYYNSDNRRYPSDLGNTDKGHYMMFYVKVQERSIGQNPGLNNVLSEDQSESAPNNGFFDAGKSLIKSAAEVFQNFGEKLDNSISTTSQDADAQEGGFYGQSSSAVDFIRKSKSAISQGSKHVMESAFLKRSNFFRTTKRTKDTIALYMPDTLTFDYKQSFSTTSVTKDMGVLGGLVQAGASLKDQLNSNASGLQKLNNMSPFGAELAKASQGGVGLSGDTLFTALTSAFGGALAINPQLEVIYQSPSFRNFRFQFMFYPRSEKEASDVLDIIDLFRYHQAPEIMSSSYGRYLIPPSEFDIKFYYNGKENTNIHSIGNCVLTDIALDFAPNGYQSYETLINEPQKGKTGMPVAIRMDLSFQETEIQTKSSLRNEYTNKLQSGDSRLGTFVAGGSDSSGIGRDGQDVYAAHAAAIASGQPDDVTGLDEAIALNAADDFRRAADIDDLSISEDVYGGITSWDDQASPFDEGEE